MLSHEDLKKLAPSVFTTERSDAYTSERFKFFSTFDVVKELEKIGFGVSHASQTKSRDVHRREYTKHMLRFRRLDDDSLKPEVGEMIPEIVLTNAHDGTSAYRGHAGTFRLVCSNGMVVADSSMASFSIRHQSYDESIVQEVVDSTVKLAETLPQFIDRLRKWRHLDMPWDQQMAFAKAAIETSCPSSLDVDPQGVLLPRRREDRWGENRVRDLWRTVNVVQENLLKGGVSGKDENGKQRHTRPIVSVDRVIEVNKSLWEVAEEFAK